MKTAINRIKKVNEVNNIRQCKRLAVEIACRAFLVPENQMTTPNREDRVASARFVAFGIMYDAGYSATRIAAQFNRERTTVLYGLRKLPALYLDRRYSPAMRVVAAAGYCFKG
jgi:chromosomal replication initiation ATPase DnaA